MNDDEICIESQTDLRTFEYLAKMTRISNLRIEKIDGVNTRICGSPAMLETIAKELKRTSRIQTGVHDDIMNAIE